uniref:Uncharacterized protein n=1 Tax=viral metagenome TaxID=1070528 RepID=A0A6C0J531_9ZZZZ
MTDKYIIIYRIPDQHPGILGMYDTLKEAKNAIILYIDWEMHETIHDRCINDDETLYDKIEYQKLLSELHKEELDLYRNYEGLPEKFTTYKEYIDYLGQYIDVYYHSRSHDDIEVFASNIKFQIEELWNIDYNDEMQTIDFTKFE